MFRILSLSFLLCKIRPCDSADICSESEIKNFDRHCPRQREAIHALIQIDVMR